MKSVWTVEIGRLRLLVVFCFVAFASTQARAEQVEASGQQLNKALASFETACQAKNPSTVSAALKELDLAGQAYAKQTTSVKLHRDVQNHERAVELVLLTVPQAFKEKLDYTGLYKICSDMHQDFVSSLDGREATAQAEAFEAWQDCLKMQSKSELTPMATQTVSCYQGLLARP